MTVARATIVMELRHSKVGRKMVFRERREFAPSVLLIVLGVLEENNCMHLADCFSKDLQLILGGRAGDAANKHFRAVWGLRHGIIRTAFMHGGYKQCTLQGDMSTC